MSSITRECARVFRGDDVINALAKAHGVRVADVLQALLVTACQPKMTPQPLHGSSGVWCDSPVSPGAGLRSIPRSRG
jgi:hypothetical protein